MEQNIRSQLDLSIKVFQALTTVLSKKRLLDPNRERKREITVVLVYIYLLYGVSLKEIENFQLDLSDLVKYINKERFHPQHSHVVIFLLERFKSEKSERYHILLLASITNSDLKIRESLENLFYL